MKFSFGAFHIQNPNILYFFKEVAMNRIIKSMFCVLLAAVLITGCIPVVSAAETRPYERLTDLSQMVQRYLSENEERTKEYPNGAVMLAETSAQLQMQKTYAVDIFRQGGTEGEARIKLSTVDLSAAYGKDYRLYLSDKATDNGVKGESNLYYYETDVPYIASLSELETCYLTQDNTDDPEKAKRDATDINNYSAQSMPHSTESILTFADGENQKTILIQTCKSDSVTDDLEFMLLLSDPENCSISASASGIYTIKEERKKPKAKLSVVSSSVNPDSGKAFVSVVRSGNLGGYDTFRLTTRSDTAKAEEDYIAVAKDFRFIPNLKEIKVPVSLMEGAQDGESFEVLLSDSGENAEIENDTAVITFDKNEAPAASGDNDRNYVTSYTFKTSNYRQYEFVDLSKFSEAKVLTDKSDATCQYENKRLKIAYDNGWSSKNHSVDAAAPGSIPFVGVTSVEYCYDHETGSTVSDRSAVVISDKNPLDDGDRCSNWMDNLPNTINDGDYWHMGNISSSHIHGSFSLNDSARSGEKNLYLALNKCGIVGYAGIRFHDFNGDADCAMRLDLQGYDIRIMDPPEIKMLKDGKCIDMPVVNNAQFTDPNYATTNYTTRATFYRYDTTTFRETIDSRFGSVDFQGIYLCNPKDTSNHSDLISLPTRVFSFTPDVITAYKDYFDNNSTVIMPVYDYTTVTFNVESYEDKENNISFTADNEKCSGSLYVNGSLFGTVSWTGDKGGKPFYDGDEIVFTFEPEDEKFRNYVAYNYRSADSESDLSTAQWFISGTGNDTITIPLKDHFFSVSPIITDKTVKTRLSVTNPDKGSFTSKDSKYAQKNSDGTVTVTGYADNGLDESFEDYSAGKRIELFASPNAGYYPVWTYTDTTTHQQVSYCGSHFYYIVQNPFNVYDNTVTLTFMDKGTNTIDSFFVSGTISEKDGSILHPVTAQTTVTTPTANAVIYMDGLIGVSDQNGNFTMKIDSTDKDAKPGTVKVLGNPASVTYADEIHRALIYSNGNYYITDVRLKTEKASEKTITTEIILNTTTTLGVLPKSALAYNSDTSVYGDVITLEASRSVNFTVDFDARNIDSKKPVNMARWSFVSEEGIIRDSADTDIEAGVSRAVYSCVVAEKAKQGDSIYIEFFNKSFDKDSNPQYITYGKFEVGYGFVNANVEKATNYMPDLSVTNYATTPEAPALGPVSPMISLKGFLPRYSDNATGDKDKKTGKDIYCLDLGVQFSAVRSQAAKEDPNWGTESSEEQVKKLEEIISKSPKEAIQNLKTSTDITVGISFAYQLNYYNDDSGNRCYVASTFALGLDVDVHISIPFTIVAVPCFVFFDIGANNVGYLVYTPNDKTQGYWTSDQVAQDDLYDMHGEFSQDFKVEAGLGVGFDGLASVNGHLDMGIKTNLKDKTNGKIIFSLEGGITAQLIFFEVEKNWKITEQVIYDSDRDILAVADSVINGENETLMQNTKISSLKLANASDIYTGTGLESLGFTENALECVASENSAKMDPVIGKISDTEYLIATAINDESNMNVIRYFIYDAESNRITASGSPVDEILGADPEDSAKATALSSCRDLVDDITITDCGDRLLLLWTASTKHFSEELSLNDLFGTFRIAGAFFNKRTHTFEKFDIADTKEAILPANIKSVYNSDTGSVHIFYETVDTSSVSEDTSLAEFNDLPISLETVSIFRDDGGLEFTAPTVLENHLVTVSDYDVSFYNGGVLLAYIGADENSLILENPIESYSGSGYDEENYGTENRMYLNQYSENVNSKELALESSLLIADEDYVTANPEFVRLSCQDTENTMLFFKCNGRYGYQNIDNLYTEYRFYGGSGENTLKKDMMAPSYITQDEDHTVGEDFDIYEGVNGRLFALWTQSQGNQQQIWGRSFTVDSVEEISDVPTVDESGSVIYDNNHNAVTEKLDKPIRILKGYWGNKSNLTRGGLAASPATGKFKGNFDALALDETHILTVYNSYDYDYGTDEAPTMSVINNRLVVAEYDISPKYQSVEKEDPIEFSNDYPTAGESVKVTVRAVNSGFTTGRDVKLNLVTGNGEKVGSVSYPVWQANEEKQTTFTFVMPKDAEPDQVSLGYEIEEDGAVVFRSDSLSFKAGPLLSITMAHADPEQVISDTNDSTAYHVSASVKNSGNKPYSGGDELTFIHHDLVAQADALTDDSSEEPFYQNFGGKVIPAIATGSQTEISFVTDDIPASLFDQYSKSTANLKLAITPKEGIGWKEIKGKDKYGFLDELGIGQFVKPVQKSVKSISADEISVPLGTARFLSPVVSPAEASLSAQLSYSSSDERILTVDKNGLVKGNKQGTAVVTISCNDIEKQVNVTVSAPEVGDVDGDGFITIIDATLIQKHLASLVKLEKDALIQADADRDSKVTILDTVTIQKYLASYLFIL